MQAALLPDRGVVKVAGDGARTFLNGLLTADIGKVSPQAACFAALLTPQGKIVADCIVAEALAADGGGFFLDCPRALAATLVEKLNFYKLRAKITVEDLSETLGVLAIWGGKARFQAEWAPVSRLESAPTLGSGARRADKFTQSAQARLLSAKPVATFAERAPASEYGLVYSDPRLPALGLRAMLPPQLAADAAADLGATLVDATAYEAHRIALGIPRGGLDFIYGDSFLHDADMDQLNGVDFQKGCYVGQEVVSRIEHRGSARTRVVPVSFADFGPAPGVPVTAGDKTIGIMGSSAAGRGLALLRLDRVEEALAAGAPLIAGGIAIRPVKPAWAQFRFPGEAKTAR